MTRAKYLYSTCADWLAKKRNLVRIVIATTLAITLFLAPVSGRANDIGETVDDAYKRYKRGDPSLLKKNVATLGAPAVPLLLDYLNKGSDRKTLFALAGLQTCWAPEAAPAVARVLKDPRSSEFEGCFALKVLMKNEDRVNLCERLNAILDDTRHPMKAHVLAYLAKNDPNSERMRRHLHDKRNWPFLSSSLFRHVTADFIPIALTMTSSSKNEFRRDGVLALIHQHADRSATSRVVQKALASSRPELRDVAAEYFSWHGGKKEYNLIKRKLRFEKDPYCRASMEAALKQMRRHRGAIRFSRNDNLDSPDEKALNEPKEVLKSLQQALNQIENGESDVAVKTFLNSQSVIPFHDSRLAKKPIIINRNDAMVYALRHELRKQIFKIPDGVAAAAPPPPSDVAMIPPIRGYFNPHRTSYGFFYDEIEQVHMGDDVGTHGDTVVSVAPGVVRKCLWSPSCGHMIVIEHNHMEAGRFCSVHMHLSPFTHVTEGDAVAAGEKIGSIGGDYTQSNGGYYSHLHFGLHEGPFEDGSWITGYLPKPMFEQHNHGWLDPQSFLRKYVKNVREHLAKKDNSNSKSRRMSQATAPSANLTAGSSLSIGKSRSLPIGWTKPKIITGKTGTIIRQPTPIFRRQQSGASLTAE